MAIRAVEIERKLVEWFERRASIDRSEGRVDIHVGEFDDYAGAKKRQFKFSESIDLMDLAKAIEDGEFG